MRHIPKPYEIYQHFKGNRYQVLAIATDSEDGSKQVVYQALYEPYEIYVRPLEMFLGEIDRGRYPDAAGRYRFEQVEQQNTESGKEERPDEAEENPVKTESDRAVEPGMETESDEAGEPDAEWAPDPLLLQFLEADTYGQKLNILGALHRRITDDMINTIAISLDITIAPGELEERYEQIRSCLITFEKFEGSRLR